MLVLNHSTVHSDTLVWSFQPTQIQAYIWIPLSSCCRLPLHTHHRLTRMVVHNHLRLNLMKLFPLSVDNQLCSKPRMTVKKEAPDLTAPVKRKMNITKDISTSFLLICHSVFMFVYLFYPNSLSDCACSSIERFRQTDQDPRFACASEKGGPVQGCRIEWKVGL